jgi:hypothetical protein
MVTDRKASAPVLRNFGGAKKIVSDMNPAELEAARQSILRRAKEKAFFKGLPIYYSQNGQVLAEYADGRIEVVKK